MNIRLISLLTFFVLSFSSTRPMQQQVGIVDKLVEQAKQLAHYVPSMQEVSDATLKAKNTIVNTINANPRISAAIGVGAAVLTSAYMYLKGCRLIKRKPSKEAPVSSKGPKPVLSSVIYPKPEIVETVNNSDQPLIIRIVVPARAHALTQLIK